MKSTTASRINGGNTEYERVNSDYYPTPPDVTQALIDYLRIPKDKKIWECACGDGHMANVLKQNGYNVFSSDVRNTDSADEVFDFTREFYDHECDWIITNPPFAIAEEFIRASYAMGLPFAMLLKSQYWHSKKRLGLFRETKPTYILPLTWRPDFLFKTRGSGSPLMDVIWCVWAIEDTETETKYVPLGKPMITIGDADASQ